DPVGEENLAQVVAVTRRLRALHVVHALGEVVDAEGNRRHEQRADVAQPRQHVRGGNGQPQPELAQRRAHCRRLHRPDHPSRETTHATTVPMMTAARPPGTLPGRETLAIQLTMMMASEMKAIHGTSQL